MNWSRLGDVILGKWNLATSPEKLLQQVSEAKNTCNFTNTKPFFCRGFAGTKIPESIGKHRKAYDSFLYAVRTSANALLALLQDYLKINLQMFPSPFLFIIQFAAISFAVVKVLLTIMFDCHLQVVPRPTRILDGNTPQSWFQDNLNIILEKLQRIFICSPDDPQRLPK